MNSISADRELVFLEELANHPCVRWTRRRFRTRVGRTDSVPRRVERSHVPSGVARKHRAAGSPALLLERAAKNGQNGEVLRVAELLLQRHDGGQIEHLQAETPAEVHIDGMG